MAPFKVTADLFSCLKKRRKETLPPSNPSSIPASPRPPPPQPFSTFHQFPQLPPELQAEVWKHAVDNIAISHDEYYNNLPNTNPDGSDKFSSLPGKNAPLIAVMWGKAPGLNIMVIDRRGWKSLMLASRGPAKVAYIGKWARPVEYMDHWQPPRWHCVCDIGTI